MAQVLIRNLSEDTVESFRRKAKIKGISLEQELRNLLEANKPFTPEERVAVSRRLREEFAVEDFDAKTAIRWGRDDEFHELEAQFDRP